MTTLEAQLAALPEDFRSILVTCGFNAERLIKLAEPLRQGVTADNLVKGSITPPTADDVLQLPAPGTAEHDRLTALGRGALERGEYALVVLAGGMATRMGGVVKALVDALPGKSFLDLRLREVAVIRERYGALPPLWLMTSQSTDEKIKAALGARRSGDDVATFLQELSVRLTPEGNVFFDAQGRPSEHAPGHGDLPDALKRSGLLERFVKRGGKTLMMTNIDNMGGTLDPLILGFHLAHGLPVTSEVVDKLGSDRGGIPVRVNDKPVVLEEFRIPPSFDPATVRVFNTNVFHFDAKALLELDMPWTFFTVNKKVDGKPVIQFERLVNEVCSVLPTKYLHLPRTGERSRFLPVKDNDELAARVPEIEAVARHNGWI
ncbi:MAG TPA: UTP--glucose-1-phosphate uridylyltransferase [Polyangiaceae bacterium]|nr:UTP--glucose-1-phosphate uridylyltransferase [Polyangiaceae bacterium]